MIPPSFPHKRYLRFVGNKASRYGGLRTNHRHFKVWRKLKNANLDIVYAILTPLYSPDMGRLARHPICMLHSCLAMMLCAVTSFYALISGFLSQDIPGVGTFYDFQDRLLKRLRQTHTTKRRPYRRRDQRDKADYHKDKNDLRPHRDIVNRLADRILVRFFQPTLLTDVLKGDGDFSALPTWEQTLQAIFYACFVARSVDLKLIDLENFHVAGGGAKLPTCPHFGNDCSHSSYGRVIYTYPKENCQLYTLIPRDSALWKCHQDARSCTERSVKREKYDFNLLRTRTAGRDRWFFRIMLAAMGQHIDAWLIHAVKHLI